MPANTVYVGRPTKWGNPYNSQKMGIEQSVKAFREMMMNPLSHKVQTATRLRFEIMRDTILDLRGKDLACWCPLDQPCHADVLLELANIY